MTRAPEPVIESAEQIEETAAQWVARIDLKGTPDEWARLDAWLAASPRHRAAFLRLSVAWRRADQLRNLAALGSEADEDLLDPARLTADEEISSVAEHEGAAPADLRGADVVPSWRQKRPSLWSRSARATRLAASVAGLLILGALAAGSWFFVQRAGAETYSTKVGEFRRVVLDDGSTIALNTNTQVRVRYTTDHREIDLVRGEALFAVAHDERRPFDVQAGSTTVRAVGTEFSVRLREEFSSVEVLVSEGRIAVDPPSKTTVGAGTLAKVRNGRLSAQTVSRDDISRRLLWTTGWMILRGETLEDVVAEFNRYNRPQLWVTDPELAQLRIGGTYRTTDPEGFANALEHAFPVQARRLSRTFGGDVIRLDKDVP